MCNEESNRHQDVDREGDYIPGHQNLTPFIVAAQDAAQRWLANDATSEQVERLSAIHRFLMEDTEDENAPITLEVELDPVALIGIIIVSGNERLREAAEILLQFQLSLPDGVVNSTFARQFLLAVGNQQEGTDIIRSDEVPEVKEPIERDLELGKELRSIDLDGSMGSSSDNDID